MTLGQAIDKACVLGDFEKSSFKKAQYTAIADQAHKMLSLAGASIINVYTLVSSEGEAYFNFPPDFKKLIRVKSNACDGIVDYDLTGNILRVKGDGDFTIIYESVPADIDANTPESYVFETPEYSHFAIPYYICYQLLKSIDTETAQVCLNEWNKLLAGMNRETGPVQKRIKNYY